MVKIKKEASTIKPPCPAPKKTALHVKTQPNHVPTRAVKLESRVTAPCASQQQPYRGTKHGGSSTAVPQRLQQIKQPPASTLLKRTPLKPVINQMNRPVSNRPSAPSRAPANPPSANRPLLSHTSAPGRIKSDGQIKNVSRRDNGAVHAPVTRICAVPAAKRSLRYDLNAKPASKKTVRTKQKKKKKKKKLSKPSRKIVAEHALRANNSNNFDVKRPLTECFAKITGVSKASRSEAVKYLWVYIKKKGLQDSRDGRVVWLNQTLKSIFGYGYECVHLLNFPSLVSKCFLQEKSESRAVQKPTRSIVQKPARSIVQQPAGSSVQQLARSSVQKPTVSLAQKTELARRSKSESPVVPEAEVIVINEADLSGISEAVSSSMVTEDHLSVPTTLLDLNCADVWPKK